MQIKGFFSNSSTLFQLGILLYFVLIGVLLNSLFGYAITIISGILTGVKPDSYYDLPFYALQISQLFSDILIFILPAIFTAYLCSKRPTEFLYIKRNINIKIIILSIVMLFLISPIISITSDLCSKIQLLEHIPALAEFVEKTDYRAAKLTEKILSEKGVIPSISTFFIVCLMAGISEELLFRGAIFQIVSKKIKNPHIAIWLVALIFSIIHFQFSGFVPRLFLGAFLGYLLFWTRNVWVPVIVHFFNNTKIVIGYKIGYYQQSPDSTIMERTNTNAGELQNSDPYTLSTIIAMIIVAIIILLLFALCAKKLKKIANKN